MSKKSIAQVLAVIPARGGSREIPRKNLRLLNGKPLIFYQIRNATESKHITDVVVTSERRIILDYASSFRVHIRERPDELAGDRVTLDPVVYDATEFMENKLGKRYDIVVTLQPTSPLLTSETLDSAIEKFLKEPVETLLPVVEATHLYWREVEGRLVPDYEERINRQWLPRTFRESGAFLITERGFVRRDSRFGDSVVVFALKGSEGLDIDSQLDWVTAESAMRRLRIVFVVNSNEKVGMGHLYRTLALADRFVGHDVVFMTFESSERSLKPIKDDGYRVIRTDEKSLSRAVENARPSIVVNDILDTSETYVRSIRKRGLFVVNFEDLGKGADEAHLVINALYERTKPKSNHRFGYEYECLNEKFLLYPPIKFRQKAKNLFLTFGGVDQNDLTSTVLSKIPEIFDVTTLERLTAVVGPGYARTAHLNDLVKSLGDYDLDVHRSVDNMPALMKSADIAVTSNGRTVYELAAMGIPTISIAQNDRETLHLFARYHPGVRYLGIASTVEPGNILESITEICTQQSVRKAMHLAQLEAAEVLREGTTRTVNEILAGYWKWRDEGDSDR